MIELDASNGFRPKFGLLTDRIRCWCLHESYRKFCYLSGHIKKSLEFQLYRKLWPKYWTWFKVVKLNTKGVKGKELKCLSSLTYLHLWNYIEIMHMVIYESLGGLWFDMFSRGRREISITNPASALEKGSRLFLKPLWIFEKSFILWCMPYHCFEWCKTSLKWTMTICHPRRNYEYCNEWFEWKPWIGSLIKFLRNFKDGSFNLDSILTNHDHVKMFF